MNKKLRNGKSGELAVASELLKLGVDIYMPFVDDQAIDLVVRQDYGNEVKYYDIQVKSLSGYNRVVGVKDYDAKRKNYILVIHFRHEVPKSDEFYFLTNSQIQKQHIEGSDWGDLIFNKPEREVTYRDQNLKMLAGMITSNSIY